MSATELRRQRNFYRKAVYLRLLIGTSVMLAVFPCIQFAFQFLGVNSSPGKPAGTWVILVGFALMIADVIGFMLYISHAMGTLQKRYGLVCPGCHAYLEPQIGKLRITDGKCRECGTQFLSDE